MFTHTEEEIRSLASKYKPEGSIFSGGFFSDILDAASIPMYAVGGAITAAQSDEVSIWSGLTEGVKNRIDPAQALDIRNPYLGFLVKVASDPLTYAGVGLLTQSGRNAYKTGRLASTFGKQVRTGQRSLLTLDVPFVKSLQGHTIIKGENAAKFATIGAERLKQFSSGRAVDAGAILEKFGGRGALDLPSSVFTKSTDELLDIIEGRVKAFDETKELARQTLATERVVRAQYAAISDDIQKSFNKVVKEEGLDAAEMKRKLVAKLHSPTVQLPRSLDDIFDSIAAHANDLGVTMKEAGQVLLDGKILPNVLNKEVQLATMGFKSKKYGGKTLSENMAEYVVFSNNKGAFSGRGTGKGATLIDGTKLIRVSDNVYMPKNEAEALLNIKNNPQNFVDAFKNALAKTDDPTNREVIQDALKEAEEKLAKEIDIDKYLVNHPELKFTRQGVSPEFSTRIMQDFTNTNAEFSTDLFKLTRTKEVRTAKKRASSKFIEGTKNLPFARPVGKEGLLPGEAFSTNKELKGFAFPTEAIKHIDATYEKFSSMKEISTFIENFDKAQNLWKGFATFANMAFHTRNSISNMWQMFLGGVPPKYWLSGYAVQLRNTRLGKKILGELDINSEKFLSEFISEGLGNAGSFTADLEGIYSKIQNNKLFNVGKHIGAFVEDGSKLGMYIAKRSEGFSQQMAAREVRKFLFDYSDITDFERETLKRIFPFYTWTRKNIPLQVSMLIQEPRKFTVLSKFKDAVEQNIEGEPIPDRYMPAWLKEAFPIYIGDDAEGMKNYFKLEGFIPAVDLNLLSRSTEIPFEMMTPLFKTPMEIVTNYSFFFEKQIIDFPGQRERFLGLNMDPRVITALKSIRPLNEVSKAFALGDIDEIPSAKSRFWQWFLGKSYSLDLRSQKKFFDYAKQMQENDISSSLRDARGRGDTGEIERLIELLQQVKRGEGLSL